MNSNTTEVEKTLAAVDLGSNSFPLKISTVFDNELKVVDRLRELVQLGAGLDKDRIIDAPTQQRAVDCLSRFGERLRGIPAGNIRAVGTNTLRKARNSAALIKAFEQALGHPIQIVSGIEEARLIYLGVAHSIATDDSRRLVMDIGGGSTEYIIGEGFNPIRVESLYMGSISMTQRFFPDGEISPKAWKKAAMAAKMELEPIVEDYRRIGWELAIGASGSIRSVAKLILAMKADEEITLDLLNKLEAQYIDAGHTDKITSAENQSTERRRMLPAAIAILQSTFQALTISSMKISDGALREGVLYNQLKRIRHEDVRSSSIKSLASHYRVDEVQSERVGRTAIMMLEWLAPSWGLRDSTWSDLLGWATQVYEIGIAIAHSQHHKHAAYILEHADLAGFSRDEQRQLAVLARSHRRKIPSAAFRSWDSNQVKPLQRLAIILRLATLLHRSRSAEELPEFEIKAHKKQITLQFPNAWLDDHALTSADLEQEAEFLKEIGYELSYK